jgi:hypothetical protein
MRHPGLLRLSLLFLVLTLLVAGSLIATAPPAAPPEPAPAATATPPATDAEAQAQADAEKQRKEKQKKTDAEKQKKLDTDRQRQTVADIRDLGKVLSTWLTEQVAAATAEREAEREASGEPPPPDDAGPKKKTVNIQDNPVISRDDLEDFLVPQYLAQIPENDAWGNPYEVRINTDNLMARTVIAIRSPGRKGYFSGDVYKIEGFDPTDFDQDIVWVDGAFVRWPKTP